MRLRKKLRKKEIKSLIVWKISWDNTRDNSSLCTFVSRIKGKHINKYPYMINFTVAITFDHLDHVVSRHSFPIVVNLLWRPHIVGFHCLKNKIDFWMTHKTPPKQTPTDEIKKKSFTWRKSTFRFYVTIARTLTKRYLKLKIFIVYRIFLHFLSIKHCIKEVHTFGKRTLTTGG